LIGSLLALGIALSWTNAASALTQTRSPATCSSVPGIGTVAWTNPGNALSSNGSYATAPVGDTTTTNYLQCVGYGFTIPTGASINGITVSVERSSTNTGTQDAAVRTVKAGVIGTTDRSTATAYPTTDTYEAHGGAADLWGTSWTAADVNNANFGAAFASQKPGTAGGSRTISVDHIEITVDYTLPAATVINTYYPGTANVAAGATSIALGAAAGAATPIAAGDLVLIMQMQDASIDATNTAAYGDGVAGDPGSGATVRNSGQYEYAVAAGFSGGTLTLSCGTVNAYTNAAATTSSGQRKFQVIRVPVYASYTLGTITAQTWNGSTGGVLAFDVSGVLTLNGATVSVDGMGFRGGAGRASTSGSGSNTDYRTPVTNLANGSKGEGIAGTPYYVFAAPATATNTGFDGYPNGSYARGAPGNAGGGGTDINPTSNDDNPGGGGGANGGAGGIGGIGWCPSFTTAPPYYGCGIAALASAANPAGSTGGFGGSPVPGLGAARLTLGGGGGAGTTNNGTGSLASGLSTSGAAGGGIIMIRAGSMTGTATFSANGSNGDSTVGNDGSGGGGAGGAVLISAGSGMGGVSINVNGGVGGSNLLTGSSGVTPHGPGGGGGGGFAITSGVPAACNSGGGANGVTYNNGALFGAYGSTSGGAGACVTSLTSAQIPGAGMGGVSACQLSHYSITHSGSGITCEAEPVTVTAHKADHSSTDAGGKTITLTSINTANASATGTWLASSDACVKTCYNASGTAMACAGTFTPTTGNNGVASYVFASGEAAVQLCLKQSSAITENINVIDGAATEKTGTATAAEDPNLTFSNTGFRFYGNGLVDTIGNQIAGVRSDVNDPATALTIRAVRTDPATASCVALLKNTAQTVQFGYQCIDPNACHASLPKGLEVNGTAVAGSGSVPTPADNVSVVFNASGYGTINLKYWDAGKIQLYAQASVTDPATAGPLTILKGASNSFLVRPYDFSVIACTSAAPCLTAPVDPGLSGGGNVFIKAGNPFNATITARALGGATTPSFGLGTAAGTETVILTKTLMAPGGGLSGNLTGTGTSVTNPLYRSTFTNGVASVSNLSWDEVGVVTLTATSSTFLGSGVTTTGTSANVGRFIPDHFETVVTGGMPCPTGLTCPTLFNGFVYSGQPFTTNVTARNLGGATTMNYDGGLGFSKAVTLAAWDARGSTVVPNPNGGALAGSAVLATAFKNGATTTGAPGAPTYSLPNPYPSATPPPGPTDIYLRAVDSDAVTSLRGGSSIEGGIKIVSGRTLIASAYGSELLKLPIGVTVQYWNGTRYVTSLTDSVTTFGAGNVAFTNCQKFLNSGAVPPDNCKPTVAVATSPGSVAIGNGVGSFSLSAPGPGNGGSADVTIKVPSYLPSTTARAGFGQYRAPLIYMRENY
jgi:hypothetical protein